MPADNIHKLDVESIEKNYNTFVKLCSTLGERSSAISNLIDHFGDRLAVCPASAKLHFHGCYVGGLIDHSLRVLSYAMKLIKTYDVSLPKDSVILACLFHDIGKLGTLTEDYYIEQTSSYYKEKGHLYEYNQKIQYMSASHRSMFLLQHFGVKLTTDEYLAILLCDGLSSEEMKGYILKEPTLAFIVHQADYTATTFEKNVTNNDDKSE